MADEQIVTNIVATSDFSSLIADVQRTTSALTKLQQELSLSNRTLAAQAGQIQKSFGETLRSTGQFTTHFVTVGSEVNKFGKNLDAGKLKLRDYFSTWQQHTKASGGLIRDLAKQQVALQNAIVQPLGKAADGMMKFNVHVANGIDQTLNKTALARKEMQIYNKVIQDGGVQLINWGKNTQWAGRQLTVGLTVPIAAFGMAAQKAFREADQELVRLTKVYGGLAATSSTELAKVRKDVSDTARELSSAYGSSYKETIGLAADIAATGKQGNELLESTREATRLSILGEVDRQEAMKATLAIQSAFKQNTTELSESINFLNAVENQTSTSLADLVEAIPKAGPVVKALGGDVQDLALYLTAMREGGINASEGANALKSALASIINPTKVAKEQFMGFGIDLSGIVNKNAGNLTETILAIQAALETLDPLKKSQAIEQLFGKFQFARMNALFENLGKQGSQTLQVLDLMKSSSQDLANVAGRELSQITESASGQYKRAVESLKADLAGLGEEFLRISTFFIKTVDGLVKFITNLPGPLKTVVTILAGFTALAGPLIMLTGVFANFIGYVIKGIGHMRALGKGGEGFKLLTPEILAAEKAGSLIEKTFYSDAQAAKILQTALSNLTNELTILQQKAAAGAISVQPTLSTVQGSVISQGVQRVADPSNPLIGKPYSRQMSHLNPVAGMTNAERAAQTIFGVVPGPGPVNQRIGKNPQIYAEGDLPKIEGLTSINGVSTGIVSQEAAKWHSMTAALAMQSEEEIKLLKREVMSTGAITTELSTSYQALLPQMTNITATAAQEARLIVNQLQAGKVTVDQARAKIIALNAQVEVMMAETAAAVAVSQGRVANITAVPLTGQPVVDTTTGKTNMKEMFHKSKTSALVDKIARSLGVRTSGGGYSTHTTMPRKLNDGGYVYTMNDGNIVPGPNVNADVVPAMLTPGEFVVNRESAQANLPLLTAINGGDGMGGPGYITGGQIKALQSLPTEFLRRINLISGVRRADSRSGRQVFSSGALNYDQMGSRAGRNSVWNNPILAAGRPGPDEVAGHIYSNNFYSKFGKSSSGSSPRATAEEFSLLTGLNIPKSRSNYAGQYDILPNQFVTLTESFNTKLTPKIIRGKNVAPSATKMDWFANPRRPEHMLSLVEMLTSQGIPPRKALDIAGQALNRINSNIARLPDNAIITERIFGNIVTNSTRAEMRLLASRGNLAQSQQEMSARSLPRGRAASGPLASLPRRNRGGMIRGYNNGGMVGGMTPQRYAMGGMVGGMPVRKYGIGGQVASMALGMAGSQIAGKAGSNIGGSIAGDTGSLVGSIVGSTAGFALPSMIQSLVKGGGIRAAIAGIASLNPVVAAAVITIGSLSIAYKKHSDQLKLTALGYNLTEDAVTKLGGKYIDLSKGLKNAIQNSKDLVEKNKLIYESMSSAGIPLKMTIEEYKKLKSEVKSTMPEVIKLINATKGKDIGDLAVRLKTQFIAAGMSAEEATKKFYAAMNVSNKYEMAGSTIASSGFRRITDPSSAAVSSVKQLNKTDDGRDAANQTLTVIKAINNAIDSSVKKGSTLTEATTKQLNVINQQVGIQKNLSQATIEFISKTTPELKNVLNLTDNGTSAWAKYQLMIQGVTVDLNTMSGAAAIALQKANLEIQKSVRTALTGKGGSLYSENEQLKKYNLQIAALRKQANGASVQSQINSKEEIKAIDKKIDAINKEYDARKKALSLQQQTEDANISIQKAQLEYQNALASGDMASAAQAQLNIRGIVGQRQNQLAQDALESARQAKIKPLEDRKNSLSEAQDKIADSASLASEQLKKLEESALNLKTAIDNIISARSNIQTGINANSNFLNTPDGKNALVALFESESVGNPDNPSLKGISKYAKTKGQLQGGYSSGIGAKARSPFAMANEFYLNEKGIPITPEQQKQLGIYREESKVIPTSGSMAGINKNIMAYNQQMGIDNRLVSSSMPKFNIPKNNSSYTPGSQSTTTTNSNGATYNMNFVINDSKMDPENLWQFMQSKIKLTNTKSGINRSK
jgi:TP901 family phage tail tape measure protein